MKLINTIIIDFSSRTQSCHSILISRCSGWLTTIGRVWKEQRRRLSRKRTEKRGVANLIKQVIPLCGRRRLRPPGLVFGCFSFASKTFFIHKFLGSRNLKKLNFKWQEWRCSLTIGRQWPFKVGRYYQFLV